jgi:hypothetical protein
MPRKTMRSLIVTVLVLVFILSATGFAANGEEDQMVIPDLLFGRPIGLIALGLGGVTYVLTLPVTIPFGWREKASEALVKKPYRFTFERELGEDLDSR